MIARFVSTEALNSVSGGWNGMSYQLYEQLNRFYTVKFYGPVKPAVSAKEELISKIKRVVLRQKGAFYFFSEKRLSWIAEQVNNIKPEESFTFYHGSTPWIKTENLKPYYCYLDASFATYLEVYLNKAQFSPKDLERIYKQEKEFLQKAAGVFFSSEWSKMQTTKAYQLSGQNFHTVHMGGNMPIPPKPIQYPKPVILFISREFLAKGGQLCFDAYKLVKEQNPEFSLHIVGQAPPQEILNYPGVYYKGYLDKKKPDELAVLQDILSSAFCLVHPTTKDMTPLVIAEANYYGVPAIAPNSFGIPEMIRHNKTGIILDCLEPAFIAESIQKLIQDKALYASMRKECYSFSTDLFQWKEVGDRIQSVIKSV